MFATGGHLPHQGACPPRATAATRSQRPFSRPDPRMRAVLAAYANTDSAPGRAKAEQAKTEIAAEPKRFGAQPPAPWSHGRWLYFQPAGKTGSNLSEMNSYAKCAANPCGMLTSKVIGLKVSYNEHLRKSGGGGGLIVTQRPPAPRELDGQPAVKKARPSVTSALFARPLFSYSCTPAPTTLLARRPNQRYTPPLPPPSEHQTEGPMKEPQWS